MVMTVQMAGMVLKGPRGFWASKATRETKAKRAPKASRELKESKVSKAKKGSRAFRAPRAKGENKEGIFIYISYTPLDSQFIQNY